jgi:hypothetical protein
MSDLRNRLERAASALEPREGAWEGIRRRERRRRRIRKVGAISSALAVAAGGIATAVVALHPGARPADLVPSQIPRPATVTVQARGFPATCTATLASTEVRPGDSVSIAFSVRNDSGRQVFAQRADPYGGQFGRLLVEDSNGKLLFDTETRHDGQSGPGPIRPAPLGSGQSMLVNSESVVVRWSGPLRLQGYCPSLQQSESGSDAIQWPALPPFDLSVVLAGPAPSPQEAMDRAVAATGGLFDTCRPGPDGQPMDGVLNPPVVAGHPPTVHPLPLEATCWAQVRRGAGSLDVTLFFTTPRMKVPPGATGANGLPPLGPGQPAEVGRWELVVTPTATRTAEFPDYHGRSGPEGTLDYDFNLASGRWDGVGASCETVEFFGGSVSFFPPPGRNACP